jgi:hypothetical protein
LAVHHIGHRRQCRLALHGWAMGVTPKTRLARRTYCQPR